jgi:UDP-N-acetylmuramoyl-tripeptide--D-alanyl-D-alanine ligase
MRAALFAIHEMKVAGDKIAVLGDMLELGEKELFWHRQVGRALSKTLSINHVILVGQRAKVIKKIAPISMVVECVANWAEAAAKLEAKLSIPQSLVLVKASHGMELHHLVEQMSE